MGHTRAGFSHLPWGSVGLSTAQLPQDCSLKGYFAANSAVGGCLASKCSIQTGALASKMFSLAS